MWKFPFNQRYTQRNGKCYGYLDRIKGIKAENGKCFVGVCGKLARFQSNRAYVLNHGSMYPQGSRGSAKIIKYILQGSGVHQWYLLTLKGSNKVFKDFLRHTEQKS